jgi:hypothetical protein
MTDSEVHELIVDDFDYFSGHVWVGRCSCRNWASGKKTRRQDAFAAWGEHYVAKTGLTKWLVDIEARE